MGMTTGLWAVPYAPQSHLCDVTAEQMCMKNKAPHRHGGPQPHHDGTTIWTVSQALRNPAGQPEQTTLAKSLSKP